MPTPLSPHDERVLRTLWNKGPQTAGRAGGDPDTIARLKREGWIAELTATGAKARPRYALTDRGRRITADLPPPKPTIRDLYRLVASLRDELRLLRAALGVAAPSTLAATAPATPTHGPSQRDAVAQVCAAVRELGHLARMGGLVSLPDLRRHLAPTGLDRADLDAALLAAERDYLLDLKVANDPSSVQAASEGIEVPGRGLLYFVIAR